MVYYDDIASPRCIGVTLREGADIQFTKRNNRRRWIIFGVVCSTFIPGFETVIGQKRVHFGFSRRAELSPRRGGG